MFLVNTAMIDLPVGTAGLIALLGYAVVFVGLIALMVVIIIEGKIAVSKKEKAAALKSVLTSKVQENKFVVLDELKMDEIKTKTMVNVLNNVKAEKALVVLKENDANVVLSARNIADVETALTNTINVYDILKHNTLVMTKAAVEAIEEVYA